MEQGNFNMDAFREGDRKTFSDIFKLYYQRVHHYAVRFIEDDPGEAEHCAADSFVVLWKEREKITDDNSILGFLFKVTKNRCINRLKSKDYQNNSIRKKVDLDDVLLQHRADIYFGEADLISKVEELINQLPKMERIVMTEAWLKGKSVEEIASQMGKTQKHIRVLISKASAQMKLTIFKTILVAIVVTEIILGLANKFI